MSPRHANDAPRHRARCWPAALFALTTIVTAVLTPALGAQEIDELMRGFAPSGDFQIEIDGTPAEDATIYLAERPQAYLILARALNGPILLELRRGTVSHVPKMKLMRHEEGTIDMLAQATPRTLGRYQLDGRTVTFKVGEHAVRMSEKPPLLGLHPQADVIEHNPSYGRSAAAYSPDAEALQTLRTSPHGNVRVRVYFGSWCPQCKRHVPFMVRVENELRGTPGLTFEYFGLPKAEAGSPPWPDGVRGVPTAVVYVDGKEVGRVMDNQWRAPELALSKLVTGASPAAGGP